MGEQRNELARIRTTVIVPRAAMYVRYAPHCERGQSSVLFTPEMLSEPYTQSLPTHSGEMNFWEGLQPNFVSPTVTRLFVDHLTHGPC